MLRDGSYRMASLIVALAVATDISARKAAEAASRLAPMRNVRIVVVPRASVWLR